MWSITPTARPWYYALKGPYEDTLRTEMKATPGCQWSPSERAWLVPFDLVEQVSGWLRRFGLEHSISQRLQPEPAGLDTLPFKLHPFQREGLDRFHLLGGGILSYEMGLGKTPTALAIGHTVPGCKLVACPPAVMPAWKDQLSRFGIEAELVETGKIPIVKGDGWVVCTYTCLDKLPGNLDPRLVVLDEAHNIKTNKTQLAKWARTLRRSKPTTPFLAMTGTLAADTLIDIYNPVDLVFPGILGNWKAWRSHYFWLEHRSGGGREWDEVMGLHPTHGPALQERLAAIVCQASEAEQAHLLPPKSVEKVWIDLPRVEALVDDIGSPDFHAKFLQKHGVRKAAAAAKLAEEEGTNSDHPVAMLFVHRAAAAKAHELLGGRGGILITGAMTPARREKAIAEARADGLGFVATMAAIKEGIDLTAWPTVVVAEFPYYPAMLLQVLKRFHRLNSPGPVKYLMLTGRGTVDETIFAVVEEKINGSRGAIDVGGMGDSIVGGGGDESDLANIFIGVCDDE